MSDMALNTYLLLILAKVSAMVFIEKKVVCFCICLKVVFPNIATLEL